METNALLQHTAKSVEAGVKTVGGQVKEVGDKVVVAIEGTLSTSATHECYRKLIYLDGKAVKAIQWKRMLCCNTQQARWTKLSVRYYLFPLLSVSVT